MKIKFSYDQVGFIKSLGNRVYDDWYYLPFFWKDCGDGIFEQVTFDKLPQEIKNFVIEERNKTAKPIN